MLSRIVASTACTALLFSSAAIACPNAGDGSGSGSASTGAASAAKKKKCKKGYKLVHHHCKRKHIQTQG